MNRRLLGNASLKIPNLKLVLSVTVLLLAAVVVRIFLFNGPFGSDEVTYLSRSLDVAEGTWSSANYNGALRYGYNIPEGILIGLFGLNMAVANLWPLLCSLVEIGAVFIFAWHFMGRRAAWISAIILLFMPLHVAVATRLHADPVVSMFLTVSFVLFYFAEVKGNRRLYFLAGVCMGGVFWTKELAAVAILAFLFYPLYARRLDVRWLYLAGGGLLMLIAHFVLMGVIAGDPLHAFKVVLGQVQKWFISAGKVEDSPWYYFKYLLIDIKHTWLGAWFAVAAIAIFWYRRELIKERDAVQYTLFWLAALLVILSFFPVSLSPLRLTMKQSNYITLFIAPIALLAGWGLASLPRTFTFLLIGLTVAGGFVLAAMEQQVYQVFTSNSKALVIFAEQHPNASIYGSVNNANIARFYELLNKHTLGYYRVHEFAEVSPDSRSEKGAVTFAVIDRETLGWGNNDKNIEIEKVPTCWREVGELSPAGLGNGRYVLDGLIRLARHLPGRAGLTLAEKFRSIEKPHGAIVYEVVGGGLWCNQS